jgi:hypothetical protein
MRYLLIAIFLGVVSGVSFDVAASPGGDRSTGISTTTAPQPAVGDDTKEYIVACYYFPNYHVDTRNEARHGKGWTEWELVKQARPRFEGHQQPKVPAWGYTDEADPQEMARKIDAAVDAGIDVFLFDWYYYDDGPFLQRGLEEGFLKAPNASRMKFALMWANHDWKDIHPIKQSPPEVQFHGRITPQTWDRMTNYIIRVYFKHPAHWKIDGRPYFSIYDIPTLLNSFGGVDATAAALKQFREKAEAAGFPGLHLNVVMWGNPILPGEKTVKNRSDLVDRLGFDSVSSYVWIHHVHLDEFPETPYEKVMDKYGAYRDKAVGEFHVPYYPNVTMGWDSTPRIDSSVPYTGKSYPNMAMMSGNTPAAFRKALEEARRFLDTRPAGQRILTINAWNEWTEGSYLEPDTINGMDYLDAIKAVFGR